MKRFAPILFALAFVACAGPACAQDLFGIVVDRLGAPVDRKPINAELGDAPSNDNAAAINASFARSGDSKGMYFPAGRVAVSKTIVSDKTGRIFTGNGVARVDGGDGFDGSNGIPSRIKLLNSATVTFNGSSITATGSNGSAAISVTGHDVTANDLYHTVEITGGTNFTTGTYHIVAVDAASEVWTLDRTCATGAASGLTGTKKGTLWRDTGYGQVWRGINFLGSTYYSGTATPNTRAAVLLHLQPNGGEVTINTGKHVIQECTFANADVGIMFGRGLAKYDETGPTYDGQQHNNADNTTMRDVHFMDVDTAVLIRSSQSIHYLIENLHCNADVKEIIRLDRGGKVWAFGVHGAFSGQATGPVLARIGGASGYGDTVSGPNLISGFGIDSPSTSMKLFVQDGLGSSRGEFVLEHGDINQPVTNGVQGTYYDIQKPVATVRDGWHLKLRNISPLLPGWVKLDTTGGGAMSPCVTIEGCQLWGTEASPQNILDEPWRVLDAANLLPTPTQAVGCEICFINNVGSGYQSTRRFCRSGIYRIGTGWITGPSTGYSDARPIRRDENARQFYAAMKLTEPGFYGIAP